MFPLDLISALLLVAVSIPYPRPLDVTSPLVCAARLQIPATCFRPSSTASKVTDNFKDVDTRLAHLQLLATAVLSHVQLRRLLDHSHTVPSGSKSYDIYLGTSRIVHATSITHSFDSVQNLETGIMLARQVE